MYISMNQGTKSVQKRGTPAVVITSFIVNVVMIQSLPINNFLYIYIEICG